MTDTELLGALFDQLEAFNEGINAVLASQRDMEAKLDAHTVEMKMQAESLAAIAVAVGRTYIASGTDQPLPVAILEDRAFAQFVEDYPLDGPPIVGKAVMEEHLSRLMKIDPSRLAVGFRGLASEPNISPVDRVRNNQIERVARERIGDLEGSVAKFKLAGSFANLVGFQEE